MSRRRLFTFIGRRLAALVLVLLAMSFLIFALLHLAPGNAVELLLGPREATPAAVAAIRHEYHLDQPFIVQYLDWLRGALHFNFGTSIVSGQPVGQEIIGQLGYSLQLAGLAFAFAFVVGIPLGVLAAVRRRTSVDRAMVAFSVAGISAPAFATVPSCCTSSRSSSVGSPFSEREAAFLTASGIWRCQRLRLA